MFASIRSTLATSRRIRLFHAPSRVERRQAGRLVSCPHPRHVVTRQPFYGIEGQGWFADPRVHPSNAASNSLATREPLEQR